MPGKSNKIPVKQPGPFLLPVVFLLFLFSMSFCIPDEAHGAFDSARANKRTGPLKIMRVTPSGLDVPPGRQIVFRFNRPVVPMGRMERAPSEIPVTITPNLECEWRWLDPASLACQLGEKSALKPATTYTVTMTPGIKTEDGVTIKKAIVHSFTTRRPKVSYTYFNNWTSPGMPNLRVTFDQPVRATSIIRHMYLKTPSSERVAVSIDQDPKYKKLHDRVDNVFWVIRPVRELPLDASVELVVEPGIISFNGPEPGVEDRTVVAFHTFPEFRFSGIKCRSILDKDVIINAGANAQKATAGQGKRSDSDKGMCDPLRGFQLLFSAPVAKEDLKKHLKITPDLAGGRTDYDPWDRVYSDTYLARPHKKDKKYSTHIRTLKAFEPYHIEAAAKGLKDVFGRPLLADIDFSFMTDHRKPDYNYGGPFFVLEKDPEKKPEEPKEKIGSEVPLTVTNLKEIEYLYETITPTRSSAKKRTTYKIYKAQDVAYRMPLPTRELIGAGSGVVQGSFETTPKVMYKEHRNKWFFSQVTPYNVHIKLGHFNTLVWITDFATGLPVKGVTVDIFPDTFGSFRHDPSVFTKATTGSGGLAVLEGTEKIDPDLDYFKNFWNSIGSKRLFVRAVKGNDMALVPLVYEFEARPQGANDTYVHYSLKKNFGHMHTWGTTAQGVYKAGDTIQYKLYARNQTNETFVLPPLGGYKLEVIDPMGKAVHSEKDLTLSEFGSYDGEFRVPKSGAVGWYRFKLTASFIEDKNAYWTPMRVLVSDFTPAPFRVTTDLNGTLFRTGETVKVLTQAKLHAGGPYVDAQSRITARLTPRHFTSSDPKAANFRFNSHGRYYGSRTVNETKGKINEKGELETEFTIKDASVLYGRLVVESAVRDDRGKYVARQSSADFVGRDRFVGLLQKDWILKQGEDATVEAVVVNEHGKIVSDTGIKLTVEYRETTASRVKGAGNAYLKHYNHKWVQVAQCDMVSIDDDASGPAPAPCEFTPERPGYYQMNAIIKDTQGRVHSTVISRYAAGKGRVLWETEPGYNLSVIPEKQDYKIGDTARYLVQNPYPGAKALITVERYGVLKSWIQDFAGSTEVVEFPVTEDYVPGFFLSVVVVSPRVEAPPSDNTQVDLGKPAFRMGYVRVPVKDPYKEITVTVKPKEKIYRPRDTVKVEITASVKRPAIPEKSDSYKDADEESNQDNGQKSPANKQTEKQPPMELAVAVLDESVFDLLSGGRSYFDPYKGFYYLDPLDVKNFAILKQLVGRQKFEKKGANAGGDGGMDLNLRSLFKFISYWNPSVMTDDRGRADIEFSLPDNLTGWMVLAMAVTTGDRMGLGDASFKVNLPTELRPVLPNQVTEGDTFSAGFTVMNRTDKTRTITVTIKAEGATTSTKPFTIEKTITAEPYKRYLVWLPVRTRGDGEVLFTVTAGDALDRDAIEKTVPVGKMVSLEAAATYGTTEANEVSEHITFPTDMRTDVGRVSVVASPTVIGNLEGAFDYLRTYPYACWEQKLTKGVMASHYQNLKHYMTDDFKWEESQGLPAKTLRLAAEYQAPGGGMVYYRAEDKYASPYLSAYTAISFNWLRQSGYKVPEEVENRLHEYLLTLLRRDVMPGFYSKGMASTVRAVALAALAPHGKVTLSELRRHERHVDEMSLFGKAHYLYSLMQLRSGTVEMQKKVVDKILSHSNQSGGKFVFSEKIDSAYERILATPLRDNCAVLSALLLYSEKTIEGAALVGDVPFKLVRTITQSRGARGRWENTQENMFCMNSLTDYSRVYEKDSPNMTVRAWLDSDNLGEARFKDFTFESVELERPIKKTDPGRKSTVKIEREGTGRLYYSTRLFYAPDKLKTNSINSGIEVHREYSVERGGKWIIMSAESPMELKTGELVRVDLYISLPTARNFVVVSDPVPGGLEPVNRDLATASAVDADKGAFKREGHSFWYRYDDWIDYGYSRWSFYHKELRHDAARFYSEYLSAGNYHLSYTAQATSPGVFTVMPLHAEEMYDPDVFGKSAPARLKVEKIEQ